MHETMTENRTAALSEVERIKQESRGLRGPLAQELLAPSDHLSEAAKHILKFHGSYQQEDRDQRQARKRAGLGPDYQFMTRSRVPGGVLTAPQYLAHDDLATRFGNGTLRVTTRQTVQLHGVLKGDLRAAIGALNHALVTTLATCGDVVRNVVTCPAPDLHGVREEVQRVARDLSDALLPRTRAYHEIWIDGEKADLEGAGVVNDGEASAAGGRDPSASDAPNGEPDPIYEGRYLPRKFKATIAFPDDNCTDVYANDLGLVVVEEHGHLAGFNVLVGGGLGQTHGKEETYPRLAEPLGSATAAEVIDVARAVVLAQRDHGDRANRRRARLKYLIDDRGIEWFRSEVESRLGRPLAPPAPTAVTGVHDHLGWHEQADGVWYLGVFVESGRIQDAHGIELRTAIRRIVETLAPGVRMTPQQNVLLTGISERGRTWVERTLREHGVLPLERISSVRRASMSCPALPTCPLALAEAERVLPSVITEMEAELARLGLADVQLSVRMTGCPNGCARPYTAELAFVGRSLGSYMVYVGGSPDGTRLAQKHADLVPRAALIATVRPLLERFARERLPDERFGDFTHRLGTVALLRETLV
jgi:sulfite reductase (ferredoxin)